MLIEQQNAKLGLLGKKRVAVVVDPASDWTLFVENSRGLIAADLSYDSYSLCAGNYSRALAFDGLTCNHASLI